MDPRFELVARVALDAAGEAHGFVLAGGNALTAHAISNRPTRDVDLFTDQSDPELFRDGVDRMVAALEEQGAHVERLVSESTFARLLVTVEGADVLLEAARDYRAYPAVLLDVGPVLDPRDALANKLSALVDRAAERDFIDVYRAMNAGVVADWSAAVALLDAHAPSPLPREYLAAAFGKVEALDASILREYGLGTMEIEALRSHFQRGSAEVIGVRDARDPRRLLNKLNEAMDAPRLGREPSPLPHPRPPQL